MSSDKTLKIVPTTIYYSSKSHLIFLLMTDFFLKSKSSLRSFYFLTTRDQTYKYIKLIKFMVEILLSFTGSFFSLLLSFVLYLFFLCILCSFSRVTIIASGTFKTAFLNCWRVNVYVNLKIHISFLNIQFYLYVDVCI